MTGGRTSISPNASVSLGSCARADSTLWTRRMDPRNTSSGTRSPHSKLSPLQNTWRALNDPTPGTKKFMPLLASLNRSACHVVYSASRSELDKCRGGGLGATISHTVFQPPSQPESRRRLQDWIVEKTWSGLSVHHSCLALHLIEHDDAASKSGSSTRSYDEVKFHSAEGEVSGRWMVLIEFAEPLGASFAKHGYLAKSFVLQLEAYDARNVQTCHYRLICAMNE